MTNFLFLDLCCSIDWIENDEHAYKILGTFSAFQGKRLCQKTKEACDNYSPPGRISESLEHSRRKSRNILT